MYGYDVQESVSSSQQDQLEEAATYIKKLREGVEELEKMKKKMMSWGEEESRCSDKKSGTSSSAVSALLKSPIIEVRDLGSTLQVVLMSATNQPNFMLHQLIRIVEEEGAQVVSASFSTLGDKVFHTLHAQASNNYILFIYLLLHP